MKEVKLSSPIWLSSLLIWALIAVLTWSCGMESHSKSPAPEKTREATGLGLEVTYVWDQGDPRFSLGPGTVVLREDGNTQRWDEVHQGQSNPLAGAVAIRDTRDESLGFSDFCIWSRASPQADEAAIFCNHPEFESHAGVLPAVLESLASGARLTPVAETIGGRLAECTEAEPGGSGRICFDRDLGFILSVEVLHPTTGVMQRLTAVHVDVASPMTVRFPVVEVGERLPVDSLHFPESFRFEME